MDTQGSNTGAAIYYHPDGFRTDRKSLMGRHAAGEGFLRAYLRHVTLPEYVCVAEKREHAAQFANQVAALHPAAKARWLSPSDIRSLSRAGTIVFPGPDINAFAWRRRRGDQRSHSIMGLTHTTATHRVMDMLADLFIAPVQPWDAVVCTSRAVHAMVRTLLEQQADYLRQRLGAVRLEGPQLPIIPLGVDCDAMAGANAHRGLWRSRLGIPEDGLAVLFFGRLSFHAKAHPFPMYEALELAVARLRRAGDQRSVHLILGGWFPGDQQEAIFRQGAATLCPSVSLHVVDGRTPEAREGLWGAADVFTLLSDNIQETYGLAPVEAMAAGLPVVVSDWDGFRDTVEDGVHGFRIPTYAPPQGLGGEIAALFADGQQNYDQYMAATSQLCVVDVERAGAAFAALLGDDARRREMGARAQAHARSRFDWRVVIAAYQDLWRQLAELRAKAPERAPREASKEAQPARSDPFRLFAGYPTRPIGLETLFALTPANPRSAGADLLAMDGRAPARWALGTAEEIDAVLMAIAADGPRSMKSLLELSAPERRPVLFRTLAWLAKMNAVSIVDGA